MKTATEEAMDRAREAEEDRKEPASYDEWRDRILVDSSQEQIAKEMEDMFNDS